MLFLSNAYSAAFQGGELVIVGSFVEVAASEIINGSLGMTHTPELV
jgi:predicted RecA/RadA family phage recombinase